MTLLHSRIALIGKSGAGKSASAHLLSEQAGLAHVRTGLICRQISKMLFGNENKTSTQILDDALTPIDNSLFLRAALRDLDLSCPFVIDSLRFESDLAIARSLGCFVIRISADDQARYRRLSERSQIYDPLKDGLHRSETELDSAAVNAVVLNNGTHEDLRSALLPLILNDK